MNLLIAILLMLGILMAIGFGFTAWYAFVEWAHTSPGGTEESDDDG